MRATPSFTTALFAKKWVDGDSAGALDIETLCKDSSGRSKDLMNVLEPQER